MICMYGCIHDVQFIPDEYIALVSDKTFTYKVKARKIRIGRISRQPIAPEDV